MKTNKAAAKKATTTAAAESTPEQIFMEMPMGAALVGFFNTATDKDLSIYQSMYEALCESADAAPSGARSKHLFMAALDLARVAFIAHMKPVNEVTVQFTGTIQ